MNRKIVWENLKWTHDPVSGMVEEENDEFSDDYNEDLDSRNSIKGSFVRTAFGIYDVKDAFNPMKQFVFWVGHVNFDLTPEEASILVKVPGIEKLKIQTRYRFMIAVGKAFEFSDVRKNINEQLKIVEVITQENIEQNEI